MYRSSNSFGAKDFEWYLWDMSMAPVRSGERTYREDMKKRVLTSGNPYLFPDTPI